MINNLEMLIQKNSGINELFARFFAILTFVVIIMPAHEWIHALVAYAFSDKSQKIQFKRWYNPVEYIDPIGIIGFFLLGIGWSKPIPLDDLKLKKPKLSLVINALIGPVSFFVFAVVCALCSYGFREFAESFCNNTTQGKIIDLYLADLVSINCLLCALNLFPIPPLDFSRFWFLFLPEKTADFFSRWYPFFMLVLVLLLLFGILTKPVIAVATWILQGAAFIGELPFA